MTTTPTPSIFRHWRIWGPSLALLAAFAAYYVFWYMVTLRIETTLHQLQAEQRQQGVDVGWQSLSFSGFPYRLAATLERPFAVATDEPYQPTWQSEALTAYVLPYNPDHVIAEFAGTQRFTLSQDDSWPSRNWEIIANAKSNWASLVPEGNLPRVRIAFDIQGIDATVTESSGLQPTTTLTADRLQLHARPTPEDGRADTFDMDLAIRADAARITAGLKIPVLGETLTAAEAQTRWRDLPKDIARDPQTNLRAWAQSGGEITISNLRVQWGPLDMEASGTINLDPAGRPQGKLDAYLSNPEALLDAMVAANIVNQRESRIALAGLTLTSSLQSDPQDRLHVPILLRNGLLYLGPLMVAQLPSIE